MFCFIEDFLSKKDEHCLLTRLEPVDLCQVGAADGGYAVPSGHVNTPKYGHRLNYSAPTPSL